MDNKACQSTSTKSKYLCIYIVTFCLKNVSLILMLNLPSYFLIIPGVVLYLLILKVTHPDYWQGRTALSSAH